MVRYADGSEVHPGDRVDVDGWSGVVVQVLVDRAELDAWGLDDPGILFRTESVGLIFVPVNPWTWDAVILLRRGEAP